MKYHLTPVKMIVIRKNTHNKYWLECGEKEALVHCWWECKLVQSWWKTVWKFLKKTKTRTAVWPSSSSSGCISLQKPKNTDLEICIPFLIALFIIAKIRKQPKNPTDEWIKKLWCVCVCVYIYIHTHIYNEILPSHKKEWNFAFCSNMNGLGGYYTKWNKSDREREVLYDITYM